MKPLPNNATGADGVKIAVFRKGRASLTLIRAAAHLKRSAGGSNKFQINLTVTRDNELGTV